MKRTASVIALLLFASSIVAHEYILIAYNFFVKQGDELELHLFVADGFNVETERPMQLDMNTRFGLITNQGEKDLLKNATDGTMPILKMTVDFEGQGLIHLQRDYARITMTNDDFEEYLKVDNIENITIDQTKSEQTERYTRYIKSLVQSNPITNDEIYKTIVGHTFEIVPQNNLYNLAVGDWINAKVYFEGKPLANKVITARNRLGNHPATHQFSRTDANGLCQFKIDCAGDWFIHVTHMIPSRDSSDTDWESFWTTFSFGVEEK
jgi:uncharacterized GH25 family protein